MCLYSIVALRVELENNLVPDLNEKMPLWYRYVDDTFTFLKKGEVVNVQNILNSFHHDIKFTFEVEKSNRISFLDVGVTRKPCGTFSTNVHRKETDTNIYLHWNACAPASWKIGTLKGLFRRAHLVCSTKSGLQNEIKHLKYVFTKINCYPSKIVHKTLNDVIKKIESENALESQTIVLSQNNEVAPEVEISPYFCLPYKGHQGETLMNNFKGFVNKLLPTNVKPKFTYKGKKLGSFFRIKDKINKDHLSNLVYGYSVEDSGPGKPDYVGETRVRFGARVHEHIATDRESSVFKYNEHNKTVGNKDNFVILEMGYNKTIDRKIAEALYVKEHKPFLNEQKDSYKLKLFN